LSWNFINKYKMIKECDIINYCKENKELDFETNLEWNNHFQCSITKITANKLLILSES
jgi:hypothetical protein